MTKLIQSTGSTIFPVPYSNPYAIPWRLPNFEAPEVNLQFKYGGTFTVAAGTLSQNNPIPINGGSNFLCRELAFQTSAGYVPGTLRVRFKNAEGKRLSADVLAIESLEGPIAIDLLCSKGVPVYVDIQNSDVSSATVQVILKGIEIFQPLGINTCMPGFEPERYVPLFDMYSIPAPGWHDEPFDYYFELDVTASQTRQGFPLPMDGDADFFWRGIGGYSNAADGAGLQFLRFSDAFNNQLSQGYVAQANELGAAPYARPILPEVCCPAYSVLSVDQIEYAAAVGSARIALRGVKRFRD